MTVSQSSSSKTKTESPKTSAINWQFVFWASTLLITAGLALVALLAFEVSGVSDLDLRAGNVAPQDIVAPATFSYESVILTEQQKDAAAQAVSPVYSSPDTQVARDQVEKLRTTLAFITTVRADGFAGEAQKLVDLLEIETASIPEETAQNILTLSDTQWTTVKNEAVLVLQQVQKASIRPDQVSDARRSLPALVNLSLTVGEAGVVSELVSQFVAPNSFYSEGLTESKRLEAASLVEPVTRSFITGETIVRSGRVLTDADIEALQAFGLLQKEETNTSFLQAFALVLLGFAVAVLYIYRDSDLRKTNKQLVFIAALFLIFLYAARMFILGRVVLPFVFPFAAFALVIASFYGPQAAIVLPIPLALLISYGMPNSQELLIYYIFSGLFAVLMLGRSQRILTFFWAGVGAGIAGATVVVTNRLFDANTDATGILTLIGASLVAGLLTSGLALFLQFFGAKILDRVTNLHLMELSRPEHLLLRFILKNAPGTYQHSLQVSNLAEQAAEQIGADALLTRVGALYHDAGKALNPQYFIENQLPGTPNLHDALDPYESANIIHRHVTKGVELARKHRLPKPIQNFILEHHGTTVTRYQYIRAVRAADGDKSLIREDDFRYDGPRPQTTETALVMLADGCEARARAQRPATEVALRELIKDTIDVRISENELDDTKLTPREINIIIDSFTSTLKGVYHPRIEYPRDDHRTIPTPDREAMLQKASEQVTKKTINEHAPLTDIESPELDT